MALIEFQNVRYRYGDGEPALDGISLSIEAGEFVCVIGGNGSGKSTFARHVNALLVPDEGAVHIGGLNTTDEASRYQIRSTVGMVFQNPDDQIVASIVEDEVAFGPENLGVLPEEIRKRVTTALDMAGLTGLERKLTDELSGGQKQRLAIAGALAMQPDVLVLDEPSSMLDPRGRAALMRVCHDLNQNGMTIVLITHHMEEAVQAERVIALRRGRIALDGPPEIVLVEIEELRSLALEEPEAVRISKMLMDERLVDQVSVREDDLVQQVSQAAVDPARSMALRSALQACLPADGLGTGSATALSFDHVSYRYPSATTQHPAINDLTLAIREGELLGIAGPTGGGKSTFAQLAGGLLLATKGTVAAYGTPLGGKGGTGIEHGVGVVFQYPERQLFAPTVFEDVSFGSRNLGLSNDEVTARVNEALRAVMLHDLDLENRSPFALSGGQQRLVALAGMLAMTPSVLVLDEPTAGLDPAARRNFMKLMLNLHDEHELTLVIISHDMHGLAELCERIVVLDEGSCLADGTPRQVFADEELIQRTGLDVPLALRLYNRAATSGRFPFSPNYSKS